MAMAAPRRRRHLSRLAAAAAYVLLAFAVVVPLDAGDLLGLGQFCDTSGDDYAPNSVYQANILSLATTLPKNASASRTLFAKASVGAAPNIVYALALCRGDANASACASCVAGAFQDAQQICAYNKGVTIFYDPCLLRYSDKNFVDSSPRDNGDSVLVHMSAQNVTTPFKMFDAAVAVLVSSTVDYAATDSSRRFGTAVEGFQTYDSHKLELYGLAQCMPDMAPADCRRCLGGLIRTGRKRFSGKRGGRILGPWCNYRYEQYPFFSNSPLLQLPEPWVVVPAPAPAPAANVTPPTTGGGSTGNKAGKILAIALPIVAAVVAIAVISSCSWRKRKTAEKPLLPNSRKNEKNERVTRCSPPYDDFSQLVPPAKLDRASIAWVIDGTANPEDIHSIDSLIICLSTLRAATTNFDEGNKLGEGGFGAVYKGILPGDQEIAVKRLSQSSRQGIQELKNELVLVAKLQHKNLVRLLGICLEDHEKLLVYEYMPNKSLDTILFDLEKRSELCWGKRIKIVNGIARGLQYLHEDSQVKIIHRDLKPSNVLLDNDYNPKISDFGLARLFGSDQTKDMTNRIVGTYGYMAPEYAMRGYYSIKSDVFSFGVLILEIVTGRRNGGSYSSEECADLLSLVWEHWTTGTLMEIIDSSLSSVSPRDQMLKCLHIGLLCVQDDPVDRPMMSMVNIMLSSGTVTLQAPSRPVFCIRKYGANSVIYSEAYGALQSANRSPMSQYDVSITELEPR